MNITLLEAFDSLLEINKINLDAETKEKLLEIQQLAAKWGQKINITNNINGPRFLLENLLDPLLAHGVLGTEKVPETASLIDVGCGGGFVGFCWHLIEGCRTDLVLLDSDRKKINFCRQVIRDLGLDRCEVLLGRVEDVKGSQFSRVVTRATWPADEARTKCEALSSGSGSKLYVLQGPSVLENLNIEGVELFDYTMLPKEVKRYVAIAEYKQ